MLVNLCIDRPIDGYGPFITPVGEFKSVDSFHNDVARAIDLGTIVFQESILKQDEKTVATQEDVLDWCSYYSDIPTESNPNECFEYLKKTAISSFNQFHKRHKESSCI